MKGIELPISTMIVIVVVLLVILGVVSLWISGWGGGATGLSVEAVKASACADYMKIGCDEDPFLVPVNFDADQSGEIVPKISCDRICKQGPGPSDCDNLRTLARCWFGCPLQEIKICVKKLCGCLQ